MSLVRAPGVVSGADGPTMPTKRTMRKRPMAPAKTRKGLSSAPTRTKSEERRVGNEIYRLHILSLHKKYALALSCNISFVVGAQFRAMIRTWGLGLPMVIAIVLFLTYHFIGVFAGNYAKEGNIHPIIGAWLSTLIMLPLSVFLTKRATADKGLMSFGHIVDYFKGLFKKKDKTAVT